MKVVFYSEKCHFCNKLLEYLEKYKILNQFKLVNIDIDDAPKEIDILPTIIDTDLTQPQKGKQAFEYLLNIKYFNNPTNNVEYVKDLPPKPNIEEDKLALKEKTINLKLDVDYDVNETQDFYNNNKDNDLSKISQNMVETRQNQDKSLSILLRMKKR